MTLLRITDLRKEFPAPRGRRGRVHALRGVDLSLDAGETLGVVGESGAGKTTLARCILGLERANSGSIQLDGAELGHLGPRGFRPLRQRVQMVFQDSFASLNPRRTVGETIDEPLTLLTDLTPAERHAAIVDVLAEVELPLELLDRYRHELSGGQQQRVNVGRAIVVRPQLVVLDEPVSALDASVRRAVLTMLKRLQQEHQLAYLLISHDLHVVRDTSTRVVIMYDGAVLETGTAAQIFEHPVHPYTQTLLGSALPPDPSAGRPVQETRRVREQWKDDPSWARRDDAGQIAYPPLLELERGHRVAMSRQPKAEPDLTPSPTFC